MRMTFGFICAAFCLFLSIPARAASLCNSISGNLVANCGFETGTFSSWTLSGNDVPLALNNLYGVEGTDPFDAIGPHSGTSQAYFGDLVANATTLTQSISTIATDTYTVSWYLAQDTAVGTQPTETNLFLASFGGALLDSLTAIPVQGYTKYSFTATATSSASVLSLKFGNDLGELLLDDVSVVQNGATTTTPEPSAWILMGTGMIGLGFLRKRGVVTAQ